MNEHACSALADRLTGFSPSSPASAVLRALQLDGTPVELKIDLRNDVYAGHGHLIAAHLRAGQPTNFRTPGGGFAPVLAVPCRQEHA